MKTSGIPLVLDLDQNDVVLLMQVLGGYRRDGSCGEFISLTTRTGLLPNKAAKKGRMMYNGDEEAKNEEKVQ